MIVMLALLLVACATNTNGPVPSGTPTAPETPPAQTDTGAPAAPTAPAEGGVTAPESGAQKVFGNTTEVSTLKIDDVLCDKATKKITFRFKNDDTKSWQVNQAVGFPAPKDLAPLRVFINSYEANNPNGYLKDGVRYFGPATKFSDNCGGVEVMKPGDDITCTLTPIPLKSATTLSAGTNTIFVDTPTSHHIIEFLC